MISLGRINLFYSRDETMKFLCLGHASNVNLFVAEQFSVVAFCLLSSAFWLLVFGVSRGPQYNDKGHWSCEENWFEINARICYRKNNKLAFESVEKKLLRVNKPAIWIDIV